MNGLQKTDGNNITVSREENKSNPRTDLTPTDLAVINLCMTMKKSFPIYNRNDIEKFELANRVNLIENDLLSSYALKILQRIDFANEKLFNLSNEHHQKSIELSTLTKQLAEKKSKLNDLLGNIKTNTVNLEKVKKPNKRLKTQNSLRNDSIQSGKIQQDIKRLNKKISDTESDIYTIRKQLEHYLDGVHKCEDAFKEFKECAATENTIPDIENQ